MKSFLPTFNRKYKAREKEMKNKWKFIAEKKNKWFQKASSSLQAFKNKINIKFKIYKKYS